MRLWLGSPVSILLIINCHCLNDATIGWDQRSGYVMNDKDG